MPNLNQSIVIGHLGRDAETRYTQSGRTVCNFSVAATIRLGERELTEWFNVEAWGTLGEACGELKKGEAVIAIGRQKTSSWETKEGETRRRTSLVAEYVGRTLWKRAEKVEEDEIPF
jgi:single-strand DNA-binding protein